MKIARWIRLPNLLIVALTLIIIRSAIIAPAIQAEGHALSLNGFSFMLICLLTVMITLGGYIINDLYDEETDKRNRVKRQAIGVWISREKAKAFYLTINLIGLILNFYLAWKHDQLLFSWIYPLAVFLLWLYASKLKGTVLWGNILVSVFCAAVALLIPFAEKNAISELSNGSAIMAKLYFYALFAGLSNLIREIIKDAEDQPGDELSGYKTLAVVKGVGSSRNLAIFLTFLLVLLLMAFPQFANINLSPNRLILLSTLLFPPCGFILFGLMKPTEKINWHYLSQVCKVLMLMGLVGILL